MEDACAWYPGWGALLLAGVRYALVGGLGLGIGCALFSRRAGPPREDEEVKSESPAMRRSTSEGTAMHMKTPPESFESSRLRKKSMTDFVLDAGFGAVANTSLSVRAQLGVPGAVDELLLQVRSLELALAASKGQVQAMRDLPPQPRLSGDRDNAASCPSLISVPPDDDVRDLKTHRRLPAMLNSIEPNDLTVPPPPAPPPCPPPRSRPRPLPRPEETWGPSRPFRWGPASHSRLERWGIPR